MYDMHYDLLTILYYNLKENNKDNITKLISDLSKMYKNDNIIGGIINLYFMSVEEMKDELGIDEYELKDVVSMFKKSIDYLDFFKTKGIIPSNIDYIYGIEGCDYLENESDLTTLYNLGLRSIIPVWNNENKFGSGYKSSKGLTDLGKKLILKAIELGIIIDLSHANENTFFDIINLISKLKKEVHVIASHSNVRNLCYKQRNLTDEQLTSLKNIGGYIGLFTNGNFLSQNNIELSHEERIKNFIKHLEYIIYKIGFDTKKIIVSTDDMNFNPNTTYHGLEAAPLENINEILYDAIKCNFGSDIATDILVNNSKKLIHNIKYGNLTNS